MDLHIAEQTDATGRTLLVVAGSIDLDSRTRLLAAGTEALHREGAVGLVLDLAKVSFVDSTGVGAFIDLSREAEDCELSFAVINPSQRARRVLEVTGLSDIWTPDADTPAG